jgi:transcriptional regulator with XRE-family HTH domain
MTLSELIKTIKEKRGLSYRQLGDLALQAGGVASAPNFHHLAERSLTEFPKRKTIFALAAALGVEPEEVAYAALESLGLHQVHKPTNPRSYRHTGDEWIVISPKNLTTDQVRHVIDKLESAATSENTAEGASKKDD